MKRTTALLLTLIFSVPFSLAAQTRFGTMATDAAAARTAHPANEHAENLNETNESGSSGEEILKEAASRPAISLKDFEALAEANNPTLKQANDLVLQSAAQARQAGLYPNPTVGYEGSEIRGGSFGGGEQGAFIQQNIVLGGKLGHRKRVFQEQQLVAEAGSSEQHYRLLGDVDQRFYSALAAQEMVRVRQSLLKITLDAVETAHQLANVGQADEPDVLQTEVESDQARVEYRTAQMNYIAAFEALAATTGKPHLP
ncbi:MAG: TolC family protein, partial [Acidobacteriota bacterium]|nr:TolC family protein [Acidobacteriota bacterium]